VCVCIKGDAAAVASLRQRAALLLLLLMLLLQISETNAVPFVPRLPGDFLTSANMEAGPSMRGVA